MPFLPFIPFADCADCVFQFQAQGIPWNLTFLFQRNATIALADLVQLFQDLDTWWDNHLYPRVHTGNTLQAIKLTDLTSQSGPTYANAPQTHSTGGLTGSALPAQVAMVTTLKTALRGRSYRGRSYCGGRVFSEELTINTWDATPVSAMQAAYANINPAITANGWTHAVGSRQLNGVRRTVGVATAITQYETKAKVATVQHRLG
jgi:hypothetical protein